MDKMKDLKDLLRHEVLDLCSAEDQIIEGLPAMIEKATHPNLKRALREHLRVTEGQRKRLDKVTSLLGEETNESDSGGSKVGSFFSGLFGGGAHKCKAMEGIIAEGNKMMGEDMNDEVMDAAIIGCAQKIEHYEICGYGTAKAFARELQLAEVATLLNETLNEEYAADNILTAIAVGGGINAEAEQADGAEPGNAGRDGAKVASKAASGRFNKAASSKSPGKKAASTKAASSKSATVVKSSSGSSSKAASNKASSSKSTASGNSSSSRIGSKAASNKTSSAKTAVSKTSVTGAKGASAKASSPKGVAGRRLSPTSGAKSSTPSRSSATGNKPGAKGGTKKAAAGNRGGKAASARGGSLGTSRSGNAKAGSKASASRNKKGAGTTGKKAGALRRR